MLENSEIAWVLAGLVLQAGGLVIIIYQLSRLNLSIRVSAQSAVYQQAADARSYLVDYPELRKYFFDGEKIEPGSEHYERAKTIAELFLNYLEHLILQQETLRKTDWTSWREFVLKTVSMSPVMQEILAERRDFYSSALTDLIDG